MGLHFENDDGAPAAAVFKTIAVPGGTSPVADTVTDVLTLASAGATIQIVGDAATDTIDFAVAGVTAAELTYLSGVTSAIQTQLNAKAPIASPTFTGTVTVPVTASRVVVTGAAAELAASATTATEVGYIAGSTGVTGTGNIVRDTSATLVTPALGVATATSINGTSIPATSTLVTTANTLAVHAATTSAELAGVISDETGSGSLVFATSPTLVTPALGVATATSINGTSIPATSTLVTTANTLAVHAATTSAELAGVISDETGSGSLVFATSPTLVTPALGVATATSINGTSIPATSTLVTTANTLAVHAATTSAELAGVISDETGSGSLVFATSPTLVTPALGVATATSINGTSIPATSTLVTTANTLAVHAATTSAELAGVISDETGSGSLVFATSPTLVTPALGVATATSLAMGEALAASSVLDVASTTKGFLEPRMTTSQRDAIGSPATGLQVYNTTTNMPNFYNGSAWVEVGGGTSSEVNYIDALDGSFIGDWVVYDDGASSSPVDGTGGSPGVTYAISTNSDLRGTSNFLFTHDAADRQGEGFSIPFTIDASDKGKVLQVSFEYLVASGTFADDGLDVWVYDVTNSTLIQPAPYHLKNSSLIEKFACEFQTSISSTSYRLIFHVTTTTATAYTIRFDRFSVGPQAKLYGSPITDWVNFTPTGSWSTNTTYYGSWRRVGDVAHYHVRIALAGAPTSATLTVNLPSGHVIDTTKTTLSASTTFANSSVEILAAGSGYFGQVGYNSTTSVDILTMQGSTTNNNISLVTQAVPSTFANADFLDISFSAPIVGWSSSAIMSSDADTRVIAALVNASGSTTIAASSSDTKVQYNTIINDTHGAFDTTNNYYVVKVPGWYKIRASVRFDSLSWTQGNRHEMMFYKNGVSQRYMTSWVVPYTATYYPGSLAGETTGYFVAGDQLAVYVRQAEAGTRALLTDATINWASFERISGPVQIAASESMNARYSTNAGQSIPNNSLTIVNFEDVTFDSHSSVTVGASWKFTAQTSGRFFVSTRIEYSSGGGWAAGEYAQLELWKNGSLFSYLEVAVQSAAHGNQLEVKGQTEIQLLTGDYIDIRTIQNSGAAITLVASAANNYVDIIRIGNY